MHFIVIYCLQTTSTVPITQTTNLNTDSAKVNWLYTPECTSCVYANALNRLVAHDKSTHLSKVGIGRIGRWRFSCSVILRADAIGNCSGSIRRLSYDGLNDAQVASRNVRLNQCNRFGRIENPLSDIYWQCNCRTFDNDDCLNGKCTEKEIISKFCTTIGWNAVVFTSWRHAALATTPATVGNSNVIRLHSASIVAPFATLSKADWILFCAASTIDLASFNLSLKHWPAWSLAVLSASPNVKRFCW